MPSRLQVVGGPLCGHEIPKQPGGFAWVVGKVRTLKVLADHNGGRFLLGVVEARVGGGASPRPANGRALYELRDGVYLYAGHRTTFCNACGCYHGRCEGGRERRPCALGGEADER